MATTKKKSTKKKATKKKATSEPTWVDGLQDKLDAWDTVVQAVTRMQKDLHKADLNDEQRAVFERSVDKMHRTAYNVVDLVECLHEVLNGVKGDKPLKQKTANKLHTHRNLTVGDPQ